MQASFQGHKKMPHYLESHRFWNVSPLLQCCCFLSTLVALSLLSYLLSLNNPFFFQRCLLSLPSQTKRCSYLRCVCVCVCMSIVAFTPCRTPQKDTCTHVGVCRVWGKGCPALAGTEQGGHLRTSGRCIAGWLAWPLPGRRLSDRDPISVSAGTVT